MQTTFSVNLPKADASTLVALAQTHPALHPHAVHIVAVRIGLRAIQDEPTLLETELRKLSEERRAARKGEVTP